jgi:hypothetical protein
MARRPTKASRTDDRPHDLTSVRDADDNLIVSADVTQVDDRLAARVARVTDNFAA